VISRVDFPSVLFILLALSLFLAPAGSSSYTFDNISDLDGAFNATSAFNSSGASRLGLGYRNGSSGDDLIGYWRFDNATGFDSFVARNQGYENCSSIGCDGNGGWQYSLTGDHSGSELTGATESVEPLEGSTMFSFGNTNDGPGYGRMNFSSVSTCCYRELRIDTYVNIDDEIEPSDTLKGQISRDGGDTWQTVWDKNGSDFTYLEWKKISHTVDNPPDNFAFRLEASNEYQSRYLVDNITLLGESPTRFPDYSGEKVDAELFNRPRYKAEGIFSTSGVSMSGRDSYINISQILSDRNEFAASFWTNITGYNDDIAFSSGGSGTDQVAVWMDSSQGISFSVWDGSQSAVVSSSSAPLGWTHIVVDWDGSTARLYVNGSLEGSKSFSGDGTIGDTGNNMFIGRDIGGNYSESAFEEFRIYNKSLSEDKIDQLYFYGGNGIFTGHYQDRLALGADEIPTRLEVASNNLGGLNNSFFNISNSISEETVEVDSGESYTNYSLGLKEGGELDLGVNFTSPDVFTTPLISNFTLYTDFAPLIEEPVFNYNPLEGGQTLNITVRVLSEDNDIQEVLVNISDPSDNLRVNNEVMERIPQSDNYYYNLTIENKTSNIGYWEVNATAEDDNTVRSNSSVLEVVERQPPLWRNMEQDKDSISASGSNKLSAEGFDSGTLSKAVLATNETGGWDNKSSYGSPETGINTSGTYTLTSFTWDNDSVKGENVSWRIWYADALSQYNSTNVSTFYVQTEDTVPPEITVFSPANDTLDTSSLDLQVKADENIDTWLYSLDSSENITFNPNISLTDLEEGGHRLEVWANDSSGNFGKESRYFNVDTESPNHRNLKDTAVGNLTQGDQANISVEFRDENSGVRKVYLATNETGEWENKSVYRSPEIYNNVSGEWINKKFYWDNNSFTGLLMYRVWIRDEAGNWNSTEDGSIRVEKADIQLFEAVENSSDWREGDFYGTSADRNNNSGILGIGYLNRTTAEAWSPEKNLTAFYRLDREVSGSGGTVKDYSGYLNSGFTNGGIYTSASGVYSTPGFDFDGQDDWVNISSVADDLAGKGFTFAGWIKTNQGDGRAIGGVNTESKGNRMILYVYNDVLSLYDGSHHPASTVVADGEWHFFAVTANSSTGTVHYYVDGVQEPDSFTTSEQISSTDRVALGMEWDSTPSEFFYGRMDEMQIYDKALNPEQIEQLYFNGSNPYEGSYNTTFNLKPAQKPFKVHVESSNINYTEANFTISTTEGESQSFSLDEGSKSRNYTLDFSEKGGNTTLSIDLESKDEVYTPLVNSFSFYTLTEEEPEYDLITNNVTFSKTDPVEGEEIEVTANVSNNGSNNLRDVSIILDLETFNGTVWEKEDSKEKVVDLASNESKLLNFTWKAEIGPWRAEVRPDPDNIVKETNETNNDLSNSLEIPSYQVLNGRTVSDMILGGNDQKLISWSAEDFNGTIFALDAENTFSIDKLKPLNGSDDLGQADEALSLLGHNDSLQELYDTDGDGEPDSTECVPVSGEDLCEIPMVNSTNTSSFQTGITYQKDQVGFDGSQPLVFLTEVNQSKQGKYGVYDYELKVPSTLGSQEGSSGEVNLYMEIR
jgi:hypothetical protein